VTLARKKACRMILAKKTLPTNEKAGAIGCEIELSPDIG
jgi:hypothetical protein